MSLCTGFMNSYPDRIGNPQDDIVIYQEYCRASLTHLQGIQDRVPGWQISSINRVFFQISTFQSRMRVNNPRSLIFIIFSFFSGLNPIVGVASSDRFCSAFRLI